MRLFKAHGLGNDYLVLEEGPDLTPLRVRQLCDRHRGVGSDGILEPTPGDGADYGVTIWNPDGSVAEKSGNGLRIFAYWLCRALGAPSRMTVNTGHHMVSCEVRGTEVTVEMGHVTFGQPPRCTLQVEGDHLDVTVLDVGNPHAVVWRTDAELDALPWRAWGRALEVHPLFVDRTNVQIAARVGAELHARIWERGAGETQASGSSACAVAAAALHRGAIAADAVVGVHMPGGTLDVLVRSDLSVRLQGPVAPVGQVEIDAAWYASVAGGSGS